MQYEHIFFDLDGTLTNPGPGIANSILYARKKRGWDCGPREEYYKFIGPPMPQSFVDFWGLTPDDARAFLNEFREYYSEKGLFENEPYPGIPELLPQLTAAGKKLYVATTKPTVFAVQILEKFGLAPCFQIISGCGLDGERNDKQLVIEYARDQCGVDMSKAVMVGDRLHDVVGARRCGLDCIGAGYGYGGREELAEAGCIAIVDRAADLEPLLMR